jgi:ergothioneine biosynthesis protein EgtB
MAGTSLGCRFKAIRDLTEELALPLSAEDQTAQSMPDVSPTKWHRAHTTWFFEEFVLGPSDPNHRAFDESFRYLFNSYYEAVGPRHPRPTRGIITRPGIAEIGAYRHHVDAAMYAVLDGSAPAEITELVELGLNHEQQHQELLLMDIKHVLAQNPIDPVYRPLQPASHPTPPPTKAWIEQAGGLRTIGWDGDDFCFDNEQPAHDRWIEPFEIASHPVSAGDVLAFIADGGYRRSELWLSDGWATVQAERWDAPLYWRAEQQEWSTFTLGGRRPVDPGEPACHLSYYEADAIARWSHARLPTEAEWESAARDVEPTGNLLDTDCLHPRTHGTGQDLQQMFGDVWEWTASAYLPYPRFRPAPGAVGEYNGKFMVNQHVLRGGSCVTPPGHIRRSYRNFFPAGARWAFSGARLARDLET